MDSMDIKKEGDCLRYIRDELKLWQAHPQDTHHTKALVDVLVTFVNQVLGEGSCPAQAWPTVEVVARPSVGELVVMWGSDGAYGLSARGDIDELYARSSNARDLLRWARQWTEEIAHIYDLRALEDL